MKADLSRRSFDPGRHYASVRKQQGRVELDSDWNEAQDIESYLRTGLGADVIGPSGGPVDGAAFLVTVNGQDLRLSPGRYYVDGTLCENEAEVSINAQPDLPPGSPVVVKAGGGPPATPTDAPEGVYVAYLHVWPQHRSAVEEPSLREEALHGPDTTTRIRTVWQVGLVQVGVPGTPFGCGSPSGAWDALTAPSTGTLAATAEPDAAAPADCSVPTSAGYRGLDNQLYRVEILRGGPPGVATYAISRDNGSVVANWVAGGDTDPKVLVLEQSGRSGSAGFGGGCFVELTDDQHEQAFQPGTVARVKTTAGDQVELDPDFTPTGPTAWTAARVRPRARRWDAVGVVPADGSPVDVELGISVTFSADPAATYATGDYWNFTARSTSRRIDWPESAPNTPIPRTPDGPRHGYARLAVLNKVGANWSRRSDCRPVFAPLTEQTTLSYLGGDGQTAPAPPSGLLTLADPLRVGVSTGGRPQADAEVRFRHQPAGGGSLTVVSGTLVSQAGGERVVRTGADGVAAVSWTLQGTNPVQTCTATLLDDAGDERYLPIRFGARLLRASEVQYNPSSCVNLAGATTVQQALDILCTLDGHGCATLTLTPDADWVAALQALPAGKDATVCFSPGLYQTQQRVVLTGLGHVRLSGGGAATVLEALDDESVVTFVGCTSVEVSDLTLRTSFPPGGVRHIDGVVTAVDATSVLLRDLGLTCSAGAERRGACVVVRPGALNRRTEVARVLDCDLTVGHAQTGVLLISVGRSVVTGCTLRTPAKPASLDLDTLLKSRVRRGELVRRIVGDPRFALGAPPRGGPGALARPGGPAVMIGNDWQLAISSTVPVSEWQAMISERPPAPADLETKDTVDQYVSRLLSEVVDAPDRLPSYARQLQVLRPKLGGNLADLFERNESRGLRQGLLAADIVASRLKRPPGRAPREVEVPVTGGVVHFESAPLGQPGWNRLLAANPPPAPTRDNPVAMTKHLRALAERVIADRAFGQQFAPEVWNVLVDVNPAAAYQGVVVAGSGAEHVDVSRNRFIATAEAVHVAFSARGSGPLSGDAVHVTDNEISLSIPGPWVDAPRAIYVGNVQRVNVTGNNATCANGKAAIGIALDGIFGSHLLARDNVVENCRLGVYAAPKFPAGIPAGLYAVVDNAAPGADPVVSTTSSVVRVSGNQG